jgi:hypothetical protein
MHTADKKHAVTHVGAAHCVDGGVTKYWTVYDLKKVYTSVAL